MKKDFVYRASASPGQQAAAPNDAIRDVEHEHVEMNIDIERPGRTGRPEVWVQGYPEGVPIRVSANGGHEPRWSPDGRELFFLVGNERMRAAVEARAQTARATARKMMRLAPRARRSQQPLG